MHRPDYQVAVVGGGFYGCTLAQHLRKEHGRQVILFERGSDVMQRASFANQARVHGGYHYPRSILTGYRSRANFQRFVDDFADCIVDDFDKYYAIARRGSNVTAAQFELFCRRIDAPVKRAPAAVRRWFNSDIIEDVFEVQEYAFDASTLAKMLRRALDECGVEIVLDAEVEGIRAQEGDALEVTYRRPGGRTRISADRVFNCTYSRTNRLLVEAGRPPLPLKHELTEMALVEVPPELERVGITVMCGPFFSLMPFPPRGVHSLSHVRYTPHCEWHDAPGEPYHDAEARFESLTRRSRGASMIKDAERYLPAVHECRQVDSLWEIKTVLPRSEVDDSRPILMVEDERLPGLVSIMGSKVDNVYDMLDMAVPAGTAASTTDIPGPDRVLE